MAPTNTIPLQRWILRSLMPALTLLTLLAGLHIYRSVERVIIDGFDRKIYAIGTTTATFLDADELLDVLDLATDVEDDYQRTHSDSRYEALAAPMRAILEQKDITYLYTFKLGGEKDIIYLIDASPEDDWCPIGYEEELPEQNLAGVQQSLTSGRAFISDVLDFDHWGLLKVASVPVRNTEGELRAFAGVDVNIDLIRNKTRAALFQTFGIGGLALLLASLLSLWIAQRVTHPVKTLKYGALRIAAGQYHETLSVHTPAELGALTDSLNHIRHTLQKRLPETSDQSIDPVQQERISTLLRKLEQSETPPPSELPDDEHARFEQLRHQPPFHLLRPSECLLIAQAALERTYPPGHRICSAGKLLKALFVVIEGHLEYADGQRLPPVHAPVDLLMDLPAEQDIRASATQGARVLLISKSHFFTILNECPELAIGFSVSRQATEAQP